MNLNDLTVILLVLGSIWVVVFHVMKIIDTANVKRDLILNISEDGKHLEKWQRYLLLKYDYLPMWIGLQIFLLLVILAFTSLPFVLTASRDSSLHWLEWVFCFSGAVFTLFIFVVNWIIGHLEKKRMFEFIESVSTNPEIVQEEKAPIKST